ncbi:MAG: hypothetical protein M1823_005844 [Watsoniomyces obsoletus]|nr:MAG: hypothetical protein M1823_005844 [Watsoniomyces obsoletus]
MFGLVRPASYIVLRLSSGTLKVLQIVPNTIISIGKYGSFPSNALLGRPYNLTFEVVEPAEKKELPSLRVVSALELHAEALGSAGPRPPPPVAGQSTNNGDGLEYDSSEDIQDNINTRSNRETIDDPLRQQLSAEEIQTLKREGGGAGREVIQRLMSAHSGIEQKTDFSLAKYALRKARKYLRRFTVLPLDVSNLAQFLMAEREPVRIMELREEMLALIGSWANVRWNEGSDVVTADEKESKRGHGRWLVVDETGGLVVAAIAERMGILNPPEEDEETKPPPSNNLLPEEPPNIDGKAAEGPGTQAATQAQLERRRRHKPAMTASNNTITVIHANQQPNLSNLKYFHFDTNHPSPDHPLYDHLKSLSWLQLLSPEEDSGYAEPETVPDETITNWKSSKRATYYRKRRRWERVKGVIDEVREGGYDGLIIASMMSPAPILHHTIPLLRGGAQVVVYSPHIEPLSELADLYSTPRRAAFLNNPPDPTTLPNEDFPVNPALLLAPMVQTARVQNWQCLPGRTHPLMTSRGGAEGYLFTATRVLPAEGKVAARGKAKRRKIVKEEVKGSMHVVQPEPSVLDHPGLAN